MFSTFQYVSLHFFKRYITGIKVWMYFAPLTDMAGMDRKSFFFYINS